MITPDLIQRSNRKTLCLTILKDGMVIVKAPIKLSGAVIDKFIQSKQDWIASKLSIIAKTNNKFEDCINYKTAMLFGEKYEICLGSVKKVSRDEVHKKLVVPKDLQFQAIISKIKTWYKGIAKEVLVSRMSHISGKIKIKYDGLKLTNAKGKWGSCNSKKVIRLNWRLVMLPPELIDYVIVHELCHIKEMNHSQKFWSTLNAFLPHYQQLRVKLKNYGIVLDLFR